MPKQYEAIRDKLISQGKDVKAAKSDAAAIYNSRHPGKPLRPDRPEKKQQGKKSLGRRPRKETFHD